MRNEIRGQKVTTTQGGEPTPDTMKQDASGQQKAYIILTEEERAKGFVRPVRTIYRHLTCGGETRMGNAIAETYARDPGFYGATFCWQCRTHLPVAEFVWLDGSPLGS